MVPVNVYAYAVLSTPQILGFTSGYILIFLRGTPQNLTRLHAYASGSPDDPYKLTPPTRHPIIIYWKPTFLGGVTNHIVQNDGIRRVSSEMIYLIAETNTVYIIYV